MGRRANDTTNPAFYMKTPLTGIEGLNDALPLTNRVILTAAGPSLSDFDVTPFGNNLLLNEPDIKVVAIAGSIRKWSEAGLTPHLWIVTDVPIIREYKHYIMHGQTILAMRQAAEELHNNPLPDTGKVFTMNTMGQARHYDNPYQVFSRGTCAIAAILALAKIGCVTFYVLGMDCARKPDRYHYDGRRHPAKTEDELRHATSLGCKHGCLTTRHIDRMKLKLGEAYTNRLFDGLDITIVGHSHQPIEAWRHISYPAFYSEAACQL